MAAPDETPSGSGADDLGPRLSVAAVARRLGVAPSTLRTWDRRYGLGPSSHRAGSHRRYTTVDLERLNAMRRLTVEGVQPAEAARIAMAAGIGRVVRVSRPTIANPAATGAQAMSHGSAAPPTPTRTRRQTPPVVPPGVVRLPIADPPPRGRQPAQGRIAPVERAADSPASAPAPLIRPAPGPRRVTASLPGDSAVSVSPSPTGSEPADLPMAINLAAGFGLPGSQPGPGEVGPGEVGPGEVEQARVVGPAGTRSDGTRSGGGRVLALADATRQARGLARAAMALDSPQMWRILDEAITADGVVATWNRLAAPVLQAVGERWRATGEVVDVEHLFSETLLDVLRSVVVRCRPPWRPNPVLLACLHTEQHILPLHALAAALAERGVGCRVLGGGLPPPSLVAAVRRIGPALVFLYARMPVGDVSVLGALPRQRPAPRLLLGGPGWEAQRPRATVARTAGCLVGSLPEAVNAVLAVVRG
jgi:DNA-binding transcriptional MerR regulator